MRTGTCLWSLRSELLRSESLNYKAHEIANVRGARKARVKKREKVAGNKAKSVCRTSEAAMNVIIVASQIEHEMSYYLAAKSMQTNKVVDDEKRKRAMSRARKMSSEERYTRVSKCLEKPNVDQSLQNVRVARNRLAHCVEYVTERGVMGNYDELVEYSVKELRDVVSDGESCIKEMQMAFRKNLQYAEWKAWKAQREEEFSLL